MFRAVDVARGGELVWHAGDQQRGQLLGLRLIGNRVGLNAIVMFFAPLGGLQVFGVLGIVLGRVLFAIAASMAFPPFRRTAAPAIDAST